MLRSRAAERLPSDLDARAFRPEIEGLRAVAVAAVVLYHLFPAWLPGGFVGVDVFFVISGFLITQHLERELSSTDRIRLGRFWARRIRRLLPAAFTVLAVSAIVVLLAMPRLTWQANVQEITASALYVENWLLGIHAVDYLAAANSETVAQHYWSLSVEEQFYLVWPVLLLLAGALASRVGWTRRSGVRAALIAVGVVSFALSIYLTRVQAPLAFFATPTRVWEFAAGGLIAVIPVLSRAPAALRGAVSSLGLLVVAGSVVLLDGQQPFPGWIAVVPVAGAALVILGGGPDSRWSAARLAKPAAVQWVGAHSYSLYLWHFPLLIAAPWVLHRPTDWMSAVGVAALTVGLAYLTKRFVEDPVRRAARWQRSSAPSYVFAAAGMVVVVATSGVIYQGVQRTNDAQAALALDRAVTQTPCYGAAAIVTDGCPEPFARPADLDLAFAQSDLDAKTRECQQDTGVTTLVLCPFGEVTAPTRTIVVVGNSHASRLIPALELYGKQRGWQVILASKTDCLGVTTAPVSGRPETPCHVWSAKLMEHLLTMPDLDGVVFASHASAQHFLIGPEPDDTMVTEVQQQILGTWATLRDRNIPVAVVEDVPAMRPDPAPECIAASSAAYDPCSRARASVVVPNLLTELAQRDPQLVRYLPLTQYFCDAEQCHALIGGVVVYTDSHHLTSTYSWTLAPYLGPAVAAALTL